MKNRILIALFLFSILAIKTNAQDSKAISLLKQYGLSEDNILSNIDLSRANYSFSAKVKSTTVQESNNTTNNKEQEYIYDATKNIGERFKLISVDNKEPKKKQIKRFNNQKNSVEESKKINLSKDDFFIANEDENTLSIGFKVPANEVNSQIAFMAHCTGYIIIDKAQKQISKLQIKSNEAFNIKVFHITKMNIDIDLSYNTDTKQYYVIREKTESKALLLGSTVDITNTEIYSNFNFNK